MKTRSSSEPEAVWTEVDQLFQETGSYCGLFGQSVAISGDVTAVGAPYRRVVEFSRRIDGNWTPVGTLSVDDSSESEFGCDVAFDRTTLMVGSPGYNDGAGRVYIFE